MSQRYAAVVPGVTGVRESHDDLLRANVRIVRIRGRSPSVIIIIIILSAYPP